MLPLIMMKSKRFYKTNKVAGPTNQALPLNLVLKNSFISRTKKLVLRNLSWIREEETFLTSISFGGLLKVA